MRENRPYGSEGGASQTNGTSLPPIVGTPQAAFSHCEKTHGFQEPFPLLAPPARRWLLFYPARKIAS